MASVFKRGGKKAKGNWYAAWTDHTGKRRTQCTHTTDKSTAERIARKFEADAALRRDGVIDPALDAISSESQRPLEDHLTDFESRLRSAGRTDQYVRETMKYIRDICRHGQFADASSINASAVTQFAGLLRDQGRSARTIQAYLAAIKGFTRWMSSHRKLPRDPLASVKMPNPKSDRRHERRILLPDEWCRLKVATKAGPERYGMSGAERVLLYEAAIQTGLRSNELRSLTRGRLFLDTDRPYVTCKAGATKNRKDARQYIQTELAASLKAHIATKSPKAPVFSLPHESNLARMLRGDLAATRKQWLAEAKDDPQEYAQREQSDFLAAKNHEGELIDFHSLRHTCGAWLAMTGAHPKVVQQIMRHQSITLTMDTYGHLFPGQEADAVDRVRQLMDPERGSDESLRATGTDNLAPMPAQRAQRQAQRAGRGTGHLGAQGCEANRDSGAQKKSPKPLKIADLSDFVRSNATESESAPSRTRTLNLLIKSQLLCQLS